MVKYKVSKLKTGRLVRGWTQRTLASLIDVDPATIGRVESGQTENPETVKKMADALGLNMEDLVIEGELEDKQRAIA